LTIENESKGAGALPPRPKSKVEARTKAAATS
jgi:hypothetical protein